MPRLRYHPRFALNLFYRSNTILLHPTLPERARSCGINNVGAITSVLRLTVAKQ